MLLGEAPRLIDDCTYVPINFIDEILMGTFEEKENGIYITYGEEKQTNKVSGLICEMIYNNEKLVQIAIGDKEDINSQTILNLSEELAAKAVELGLKEGSYIEAEITDIQTASIPPQVIPTSLTTTDLAIDNTVEVIGTVCELVYNEDNILTQIIIGTKDDPATQTAFNLADGLAETVKELDIKEGSKIIVAADPVQTKSIPPQQFIHSIDLLRAVDISGTVCEVIYEEEKIIQIAIGDKEDPMSQVVFNLTDELSEIAKNLDIKEGTKIKGTAKDIQTMSIPPQQPLLTLEIDK